MTTEAPPAETPRMSPGAIAAMRRAGFCQSRWLVRLTCFGETILGPGHFSGSESHVVTITPSSVGPELAESAVGIAVNYLVRQEDGWRCHWRPNGTMLRGIHSEVCCGFVESAWPDEYGIMGVLLIFGNAAHADLCDLARAGDLAFANVCMPQDLATVREVTPWGLLVATATYSRAISVDFNSLALSQGSRVLRQLGADEEPRKDESLPPSRIIVPRLRGETVDAVTTTTDPGGGTVGSTEMANNAVETSKRQNVNSATHSPTWPSGGSGVTKSVEYSVSVSIGESYMGSWWADLPGSVTFDAAQAYGMVPVRQDTSSAKAWATTTLNIPTPTAIQGTFFYW